MILFYLFISSWKRRFEILNTIGNMYICQLLLHTFWRPISIRICISSYTQNAHLDNYASLWVDLIFYCKIFFALGNIFSLWCLLNLIFSHSSFVVISIWILHLFSLHILFPNFVFIFKVGLIGSVYSGPVFLSSV